MEPEVATTNQDSQTNFAGMVGYAIGIPPARNLLNYGCYCGLGNDVGVIPLDATDSCCMTHDYAWMGAPQGCDCNTETYAYTTWGAEITCTANQNACATYCCAADKAFAECVQTTTQNRAHSKYNRNLCERIECLEDEWCDAGTWCNGYRCVPFCGGGGGAGFEQDTDCDFPTMSPVAR